MGQRSSQATISSCRLSRATIDGWFDYSRGLSPAEVSFETLISIWSPRSLTCGLQQGGFGSGSLTCVSRSLPLVFRPLFETALPPWSDLLAWPDVILHRDPFQSACSIQSFPRLLCLFDPILRRDTFCSGLFTLRCSSVAEILESGAFVWGRTDPNQLIWLISRVRESSTRMMMNRSS